MNPHKDPLPLEVCSLCVTESGVLKCGDCSEGNDWPTTRTVADRAMLVSPCLCTFSAWQLYWALSVALIRSLACELTPCVCLLTIWHTHTHTHVHPLITGKWHRQHIVQALLT